MKHPIYAEQSDRQMMQTLKEMGHDDMLEKITPFFGGGEKEAHAYVRRITIMSLVAEYGCNLIQLRDAAHWDEALSEKTLMQMRVEDIKTPYPAFTIDVRNAEWTKFEYVHVSNNLGVLALCFEVNEKDGHRYHNMNLEHSKLLEYEVDIIAGATTAAAAMELLGADAKAQEMLDLRAAIYKIISIILFTSMFQKVTDKVEIVKVVNKGSKKRLIPNHNTSLIYLSQPSYKLLGKSKTGARGTSEKTWMQKGHFRRQPYGSRSAPQYKSIWIDAMWKGKGSKVLERIIKV